MSERKEISIPGAPAVEGLKFRRFRGENDYPLIVEIFNACRKADDLKWYLDVERVAHHFTHLERSDPFTDMVFVEIEHKPVAYARVGWFPESCGDHIYYGLCWVLPEWRKKGIGTALLLNNERRIREIAREHPADGNQYFQNDFSDKQSDVEKLLLENGYQPVRWGYEMTRGIDDPLPKAPMPEGLEVRKPRGEADYRAIFEAENEAFRDQWGHVEPTEESYQGWLTQPNFNPDLWRVAWDGDQVAGMVLNFLNEEENRTSDRKRGYTEDISVREPYRRQGLARSLLVQSIEMFREMGMEETALGVDTQNPNHALRLYQSVGYSMVSKHTVVRKALEGEE